MASTAVESKLSNLSINDDLLASAPNLRNNLSLLSPKQVSLSLSLSLCLSPSLSLSLPFPLSYVI